MRVSGSIDQRRWLVIAPECCAAIAPEIASGITSEVAREIALKIALAIPLALALAVVERWKAAAFDAAPTCLASSVFQETHSTSPHSS